MPEKPTPRSQLRAATADDIKALQAIEVDAGKRFAEVGLHDIANAPPPSREELAAAITRGTCWVAAQNHQVIGYASAEVVDGEGHLHQVSVASAFQGAGHGRALIERAITWASFSSYSVITLTTFADLSWNGPLYAHLGFVEMTPAPGSELEAIRHAEIAAGLDVQRRVAMGRPLA